MTTDVRKADLHEVLERYHVRYEVHPYYLVWDQRPESAPEVEQRVQAGFNVDLYATLEKYQFPLFHTEEAHLVVNYFESLALDTQLAAGQQCTVQVIPDQSLTFDAQKHFQPQVMLEIRISHNRGLDKPAGPAEEKALKAICDALEELGIRES